MGDSMSTIINATTTNGVVIQPDNSGSLVLQTNNGNTALTIDTSQNVTLAGTLAMSSSFMRNRIINGDMRIDQRNAGASSTPTNGTYQLDRWQSVLTQASKFSVQQNAGAITPPVGFTNYLGVTSSSAYSVLTGDTFLISQLIEGYNVADLGWGTANAKTVTLSFQVYSSLTGTFGGALLNGAANRSYTFSYSVPVANTWTTISVTIAGDTSGTWLTTNGIGMYVRFGLGSGSTFTQTANSWGTGNVVQPPSTVSVVGTNGATLYITGVQLEIGTSATPFERRLYNQELAACQRYFETLTSVGSSSSYVNYCVGGANSTTAGRFVLTYKVQKRSFPSVSFTTASGFSTQTGSDGLIACTAITAEHISETTCQVTTTVASGLTAGASSRLITNNNNTSTISISAEL
jgi:hypothetical protein